MTSSVTVFLLRMSARIRLNTMVSCNGFSSHNFLNSMFGSQRSSLYSKKIFFKFWKKPQFNSFRHILKAHGRQMSRKTVAWSLADGVVQFTILDFYMRTINHDSATVNISVFTEQRNISFQNDISLKTTRLGVVWWEKFKNRETQRIAS